MSDRVSRRFMLGGLAAAALLPTLPARAEAQVTTTRIVVEDDRVWIAASIAGSHPYLFVIDTGGVISLIQPHVAEELRLRARARRTFGGVGGTENFILYEARDVLFASGLRQPSVVFGAAGRELALGQGAAGTFAAGLFTAADSDVDFERGEWRLYPDGRGDRPGFAELPSQIAHEPGNESGSAYVYVDAEIDGGTYRLIADTGTPGQISLGPAATRRSGLWNDASPYAPVRGEGIGGHADRGRLVRAGQVRLGGIVFERPLISLVEGAPPHAYLHCDGIIGLSLLQRMNLSTDVRRARLWAQRNARPAPPERYRMTGLWLDQHGADLVVAEVSPSSPAAEAGIRAGDRILGTDLPHFLHATAGQPGTEVPVRIGRAGREIAAMLRLRPFL